MASISRFGRAVSSGSSASDKSLANRASVSSAVLSSRFAKSVAVPVVIKNSSSSIRPDNPLWHRLRQSQGSGPKKRWKSKELSPSYRAMPTIGAGLEHDPEKACPALG
jgi:hypothetical protein